MKTEIVGVKNMTHKMRWCSMKEVDMTIGSKTNHMWTWQNKERMKGFHSACSFGDRECSMHTNPWWQCCKSIEEEFLSIGCDLQKTVSTMNGEGKLEEDHSESSGRHRDIQDMEHCRSMLEWARSVDIWPDWGKPEIPSAQRRLGLFLWVLDCQRYPSMPFASNCQCYLEVCRSTDYYSGRFEINSFHLQDQRGLFQKTDCRTSLPQRDERAYWEIQECFLISDSIQDREERARMHLWWRMGLCQQVDLISNQFLLKNAKIWKQVLFRWGCWTTDRHSPHSVKIQVLCL